MKFKAAPDNTESCIYCRMLSENNVVEIGIYPVMYGYRVRAGFVSDPVWSMIDYCGGNDQVNVEILYGAVLKLLENRTEQNPFIGLHANNRIKPFYRDEQFMKWLFNEADSFRLKCLPPLEEVRIQFMKERFSYETI